MHPVTVSIICQQTLRQLASYPLSEREKPRTSRYPLMFLHSRIESFHLLPETKSDKGKNGDEVYLVSAGGYLEGTEKVTYFDLAHLEQYPTRKLKSTLAALFVKQCEDTSLAFFFLVYL